MPPACLIRSRVRKYTSTFPNSWNIACRGIRDVAALPGTGELVLDGEALADDEHGNPDFHALLRLGAEMACLCGFDLLMANGQTYSQSVS